MNEKNWGIHLKLAPTESYLRSLIQPWLPDPLWKGSVEVEVVGELDVVAQLREYRFVEIYHSHVDVELTLVIDCTKSKGLFRSKAQLNMKVKIRLIPQFEQGIWNDMKVDVLGLELLDDSKIKVGPITLPVNMVERILGTLKSKIEGQIMSMIHVPQLIMGLSSLLPDYIPIMDQPRIYLKIMIAQINILDLARSNDKISVSGQLITEVQISDTVKSDGSKLPIIITNESQESDIHCPIQVQLTCQSLEVMLNQNLDRIEGLPDGVHIRAIKLSSVDNRLVIHILGDVKGIDELKVECIPSISGGRFVIAEAKVFDIRGSFLVKNLLKVSESYVVSKTIDVVSGKLNQFIHNFEESIKTGLHQKVNQFDILAKGTNVELQELRVDGGSLNFNGRVDDLTFDITNIPE